MNQKYVEVINQYYRDPHTNNSFCEGLPNLCKAGAIYGNLEARSFWVIIAIDGIISPIPMVSKTMPTSIKHNNAMAAYL